MEPNENHSCCMPLRDLSNQINEGVESGSNPLTQVSDPRELKRQRDRARLEERHVAMIEEQRSKINRKRREAHHKKKANSKNDKLSIDGDVATDIENTVDTENNDWLHINQSYQPVRIGECSLTSVDNSSIIDLNKIPCTKDCVDTNLSHDCGTPATFDKSCQQYFRKRYVNMAPEQREARREQQ
ncbi:uncharacterized protein [Miscanthus floridulus]|uniref:uncharacterized protein n=1 Tax=Miscanthus floridulus TaxID=154761 RepID=UPI0034574E98